MHQDAFSARHRDEWSAFERWLEQRAEPKRRARKAPLADAVFADDEFPAMYRRICQHLALAERRDYSTTVVGRLRELAARGHRVLYRAPQPRAARVFEFFAATFPRLVRSEWKAMAIAAALLFVPLVTMVLLLQARPEFVHAVFDPEQIARFEAMYDPVATAGRLGRDSGSDLEMFGFYILNNVGIGFRTFASGLLAGIGSIFVLVTNGVMIGTAAGHLTAIGSGDPFWRFVAGHSAPELLAIVVSGGAGLQIGFALIAPGRRSRGRALVESGVVGAKLVLGAFAMLVFAAFVEAYWSSIASVPREIKFAVGTLVWGAIALWFVRGGRDAPPRAGIARGRGAA